MTSQSARTSRDPKQIIAEAIARAEPVVGPTGKFPGALPGRPHDKGGRGQPPSSGEAELNRRLALFPLTDLGNAERFVARNRGRFLWCAAIGWLAWDDRRWRREGSEEKLMVAAHECARAIQDEAEALRGTPDDYVIDGKRLTHADRVAAWGRSSEGANRLRAIGDHAAPKLAIATSALDANPFLINVNNGTLVVSRNTDEDYVSLRPHDPNDLLTKLVPVDYLPDAARPVFDAFLAYVQPAIENRRFLQQWHGLSLTGDVSEQVLVFYWGKGKNGKSTLVDAASFVAGDYGETIPIETFLSEGRSRNAGAATPDLAILPGVRFLRTSEPEKGAKLAESLIKLVTGGEPIQARHLNRDYFRFYPQFKLTMSGNYRPEIRGSDEGIWRRVRLVPWTVTVPEELRDPSLPQKLRGEASGILNWMLDGLRDWLDNRLSLPTEVEKATATYRSESDPLGRFLAVCVQTTPGRRVQSSVLHRVFLAWAKANGEREWSATGFGKALREHGLRSKHSDVIWWLDLELIKAASDFIDLDGNPIRNRGDNEDDLK